VLAFQAKAIEEVGKQAGLSLVEYGIVGIVLLLSLGVNIICVRKLMQVQDQRVSDKEADGQRLERITTNLSKTVADVTAALTNLERSDNAGTAALQSVKTTLDHLLLATLAQQRHSPPRGIQKVSVSTPPTEGR